jgi:chemotaxis protein CheX
VNVTGADVREVTAQVWAAMLGLDVDGLAESDARSSVVDRGEQLVGSVCIRGAWHGVVAVRCSRSAAVRFAARLLSVAPAEVDDSQAVDAVGELANIVGGNLKTLLPGPSELTTPVVEGHSLFSWPTGDADLDEVACVHLASEGHPFEVLVRSR